MLLGALCFASAFKAEAQSPLEASNKAWEMGMKYAGMGFYLAPSKEGKAGFGTTLEFTVPVNRNLDYVFIVAGDKYVLDVDIWIEAENGQTIVKDTRPMKNGVAGVGWRSQYNGTVNVVVYFADVTSRASWAAMVGRRGNVMASNPYSGRGPGPALPSGAGSTNPGSATPGSTPIQTQ